MKLENLRAADKNSKICVDEPLGESYVATNEMVLFTYQSDSRRWGVLLKDGSKATMKRDCRAEQILALSPSFTKLKTDTIVNMDYIRSIGVKDQRCILVEPFSNIKLSFSRRSAKKAKELVANR